MRRGFQGVALRQFTRLFESGTLSAASDRELLDEFARRRDDAAFEVLLTRYGRLVLNLGRKLLHDPRDVEDAFQATFLVLVRKPPRLRVGESLGPWMSTVAYRVAARARANRIRLNKMETTDGLEAAASTDSDANSKALALHEELNRLPERLRRPVVCCYLEGLTHERAAERLGCPVGTVRSRLARARSLLHRRLSIRGVAPAVAPLEVLFSSNSIDPPLRLIDQTMRLVASSHVRWPEAGVVSASLLSLANGVVRMMNLKKALVALSVALPLGGIVAVGAAQAYQQAAGGEDEVVLGGKIYRAVVEPGTYPQTYYVGDLLGAVPAPLESQKTTPSPSPEFDPSAVIKLIERHIAPGTWKILDTSGKDLSAKVGLDQGKGGGPERRIGSITPFHLSLSLIIRHTAEVHEQVADLLRSVRAIVQAAEARAVSKATDAAEATPTSNKKSEIRIDGTNKKTDITIDGGDGLSLTGRLSVFGPGRLTTSPADEGKSSPERTARVRQLLKALQDELDELDAEAAKASPTTKGGPLRGGFDTPRR
ncbi:MAG: sigma-70 family RNA polymerase sigma factor [Paludisphaera borealis]|uniref:RNA polymerase sigma factor n=1 Tax=Paludisphaera borealis TaxID=1387353 RepID=UPI00283C6D2D|nr:sigma-70 family RNA polymerase sigma factor [Paludisphaera borealis]MDR3618968.1 sigma-70 family RNA polymerase sigma factor [Paludisphaera borealis]